MALIKCSECGHEISDRALSCPNCGCPIDKEDEIQDNNLVEVKILKEKLCVRNILIIFIISFILFILLVSSIKFGSSYDGSYSIMKLYYNNIVSGIIKKLVFYGLFIFGGFILSMISKKMAKIAKVGYILALGIFIYISYKVTLRGVALTWLYSLMYILTASLIFIRINSSLKEEVIDVDEFLVDKYNEENKKIEEEFSKAKDSKIEIIGYFVLMALVLGGLIFTTIKFTDKKNIGDIPADRLTSITQIKEDKILYVKVINDFINVRKEPKTSADKIGKVIENDIYQVVDIKTGNAYNWYKVIDKNSKMGYIANPKNREKYLTLFYLSKNNNKQELSLFQGMDNKEDNINIQDEGINNNDEFNDNNKNFDINIPEYIPNTNINNDYNDNSQNNNNQNNNKNDNKDDSKDKELEAKKKECALKISDREKQYSSDYNDLKNQYEPEIASAKYDYEERYRIVNNSGGYISESTCASRRNSINNQISDYMSQIRRLSMDTSGKSQAKLNQYYKKVEDLRGDLQELDEKCEISRMYDYQKEVYVGKCEEYKYKLNKLNNDYKNDIKNIQASCPS